MTIISKILCFLPFLLAISSCREDELVVPTEYDIIPETPAPNTDIRGFYLVNEGNMGSNKWVKPNFRCIC